MWERRGRVILENFCQPARSERPISANRPLLKSPGFQRVETQEQVVRVHCPFENLSHGSEMKGCWVSSDLQCSANLGAWLDILCSCGVFGWVDPHWSWLHCRPRSRTSLSPLSENCLRDRCRPPASHKQTSGCICSLWSITVPVTSVMALLMSLGVTGNSCVIYVYRCGCVRCARVCAIREKAT